MGLVRILSTSGGADLSGVTTIPEHVLTGDKYVDSNGILQNGTMQKATADWQAHMNADDVSYGTLSGDNPSVNYIYLGIHARLLNKYNDAIAYIRATRDIILSRMGITERGGGNNVVAGEVWGDSNTLGLVPPANNLFSGGSVYTTNISAILSAIGAKRFATGTVSSATGNGSIEYYFNGIPQSSQAQYFTITGLSFTPSIVIVGNAIYYNGKLYVPNGNSSNVYNAQTYVEVGAGTFTMPLLSNPLDWVAIS